MLSIENTEKTRDIILENLHLVRCIPVLLKAGPRYCPSIEDKIVRFADKPTHQVFLNQKA